MSTVQNRLNKGLETLSSEERAGLINEVCGYAETDLMCYQSEDEKLYDKQQQIWEPVLKQIELAFAIRFNRTTGILPVHQPEESIAAIRDYITALDDRAIIVIGQLTSALGSVFLAVAWMKQMVTIDEAIIAAQLDENHQAERWGEDEDVMAKLAEKASHIRECADFYNRH